MFLFAMQTLWSSGRCGSKFVNSRLLGRRSAVIFAPYTCRMARWCSVLQLISLSSRACASTRMHGLLDGRPRPFHLAFGWHHCLHAFHPQTCTRSKNKARDPTPMEQFPWLDEYVGRPRGKNPSTRRAAAAESREDDRHLLQVNWDAKRTIYR